MIAKLRESKGKAQQELDNLNDKAAKNLAAAKQEKILIEADRDNAIRQNAILKGTRDIISEYARRAR